MFGRAGAVETVKVVCDAATGRARGFAFVEMATDQEANQAISEFHEFELGGRRLTVNEARPRNGGAVGAGAGGGGHRRSEPRW
jgi:RNA recognition motif-containing protein